MGRRRPHREIAFSFDAFLDVVANVVGIIIRLILVAWVGARSYKAIVPPPLPPPAAVGDPAEPPEPTGPGADSFAPHHQAIAAQAEAVRHKEGQHRHLRDEESRLQVEIARLAAREDELAAAAVGMRQPPKASSAGLSVEQLRQRSQALLGDLEKLRALPPARKTLRYQTPVSAPVQSEEVMFECRRGRVTLVDTAALLAHIQRESRRFAEQLRDRWEVSDVTPAVGAFRVRYHLERERSMLDGPAGGKPLEGTFRYGLASWEVEPVLPERGEAAEQALADGSAFRRVSDALDAGQTVVTFWVYPDSFPLYRRLRDHLHSRDVVVAGRPLPEGRPIGFSRQGTASRGQ